MPIGSCNTTCVRLRKLCSRRKNDSKRFFFVFSYFVSFLLVKSMFCVIKNTYIFKFKILFHSDLFLVLLIYLKLIFEAGKVQMALSAKRKKRFKRKISPIEVYKKQPSSINFIMSGTISKNNSELINEIYLNVISSTNSTVLF